MRLGSLISALGHVAIILLTIFSLPTKLEQGQVVDFLPVDLVPIDEITNIMAKPEPQPEKETEAAPEPKTQEQKTALVEPTPPPPEPEPEPEPEEIVPLEEDTPPEPEPEEPEPEAEAPPPEPPKPAPNVRPVAKPKIKPAPQPEPEVATTGDEFLDSMAALLDKQPDDTPPPQPELETPPPDIELPREGAGAQTALTMSEEDAFRAQMAKCWTIPAGAANSEDLYVTLRVFLNSDGSLARAPELVSSGIFDLNTDPFYRTAAESALRAIQRCQPFKLPPDKYNSWKELKLNFNPSQMLR